MDNPELPPTTPRRFYVKRKQLREEEGLDSTSIFAPSSYPHPSFTLLDDPKKLQTLTTAIDNTLTLSNTEEPLEERATTIERSQLLPKLQSRLPDTTGDSRWGTAKGKAASCHLSDPQYLRLEKQVARRVNRRLKEYQKGWSEQWQRRKEKSIIERLEHHAQHSIEHINLDAHRRKNTSDLAQLLRNNIVEKTFIFPGRPRRDLQGLRGKGAKVVPLFSEVFLIEEVYKRNKHPS